MFALLKQHVPRIAELKPGVVTVKFLDGKEDSYFVSGGFAFMHKVCNFKFPSPCYLTHYFQDCN